MGTKLQKTVDYNTYQVITDYRDGYQYETKPQAYGGRGYAELLFFLTAEGYVKALYKDDPSDHAPAAYQYVYIYKDHLGNNRLSYTLDPETNQIKILEENHYYPFGLKHGAYNQTRKDVKYQELALSKKEVKQVMPEAVKFKYLYNGKELQHELGVNWYDYGARNYQADLGRWFNIDPLAEKYASFSSYNFTLGNPVRLIDVLGLEPEDIVFNTIDEDGNKTELGRIVTDKFDEEFNISQDVIPFDIPDDFESVEIKLDNDISKVIEKTGAQAFSLDFSGEVAFKIGGQVEVSIIGIVAGENKGDWGITLQGNGLVGLEASGTVSASAYWPVNNEDLSLLNLSGFEYGVQGSAYGASGAYFEGFSFTSSYPFVEKVYGGVSFGGSIGIPELGGSGSGYIGYSEFIYKSIRE